VAPRFRLRTGRTEVIPVPGTRNLLLPVPKSSRFPVPTPFRGSGWEPGTPMGRPRFRNHDGNHGELGAWGARRTLRMGPRKEDRLAPSGETPPTAEIPLFPSKHAGQPGPRRCAQRAPNTRSNGLSAAPERRPLLRPGSCAQGLGASMFDPGVFPRRLPPPSVTPLRGPVACGVCRCGEPRSVHRG